jgi:MATE family multidrug resistance protein
MTACGSVCVIFSDAVARGFSADPATVMTLTAVMPLVALLMIPDGGQGVIDAVLRAGGDNWFPTAARTVAFVVIAPLLAFWLAEHEGFGIAGILAALVVASFLAYGAVFCRFAIRAGVRTRFRSV